MNDRELASRLRGLREDPPPPSLAARLERAIPENTGPTAGSRLRPAFRVARWAAVAVVLIAIAVVLPQLRTRRAALGILDPVVLATGNTDAVHVVLLARTGAREDPAYIQIAGPMRRVEAWLEDPHHVPPGRALIDKGDRVYGYDGRETTRYFRSRNEALRFEGQSVDTEPFWPAAWVQLVGKAAASDTEVLAKQEVGDTVRVLLFQKGLSREPLPRAFLNEFDRETELVWDRRSQRLVSMRRFVRDAGKRILVAETERIEYLPAIADARFRIDLPEGVRWIGLAEASPEIARLTPVEVTRLFFEAGSRGGRDVLAMVCSSPAVIDYLLEISPTEVLSIGQPIRKASYPGVFVPYRVRLKDGRVLEHRLALRDDNPEQRWEYDGGL